MDFRKIPSGWKPDPPDHRDVRFTDVIKLRAARLPSIVDMRGSFRNVNSQGELGSCTAQAASDGMEYVDFVEKKPRVDYSRLFLYYNSRDNGAVDDGASLRDTFKSLNRDGICEESMWPYDVSKWSDKPSPTCYENGLKNTAIEYLSVDQGPQVRQVLAEGFPLSFGMNIYEMFYELGRDGFLEMPNPREAPSGRHAMLIVGYKTNERLYIVRNSWGDWWGEYGYCYIPYDYVDDSKQAANFWVVKKKGQGSPTPRVSSLCGWKQRAANRIRGAMGMKLKSPPGQPSPA